ncbi:hypothetical protein TNIN_296911 [Trichonephila inaurata madagascariensis]|uniref:Pre-C2HC domain-containing protein n=1 Tax=Trichonephila inaurata madagascariensis TaxID=2747483 RepID=A0A8X6XTN6_9ARAC|nr:hypothetical protein TNIN_296911 [Trichonephila inaurata madagascariensis]
MSGRDEASSEERCMEYDAVDPTLDIEQHCAFIRAQEKEIAYHEPPKFTLPLEEFPELPLAPAKNPILIPNNPGSKNFKNKNSPGNGEFVSPSKHSKKPKMLENSDISTVVSNKYSALAGATANTDLDQTSGPVANKITPIMLRCTKNFNLILQQLEKDFLKSTNKLTGKYIKINSTYEEEQRKITSYLKLKNEQFFVFDPPASCPQKIVLKGLPTSTDIQDIKSDLKNQGYIVERIAHLTKSKIKNSPYPSLW